MEKIKLSFSQIDKVMNKPRQWLYEYYFGQWLPMNDAYALQGTGVHAVGEESVIREMTIDNYKEVYDAAFKKDLWKIKHLYDKIHEESGKYLIKFRQEEGYRMAETILPYFNKMKGGKAEEHFEFDINDRYLLHGYIDRELPFAFDINEIKEGRRKYHEFGDFHAGTTLVDYKTASFKNYSQHNPTKSLQLFIYAYNYYIKYWTIPEVSYIIVLRDEDFSRVIIKKYKPTIKDFKWMWNQINEAISMIEYIVKTEESPTCHNNGIPVGKGLCSPKWCMHWKQCQENEPLQKPKNIKQAFKELKESL